MICAARRRPSGTGRPAARSARARSARRRRAGSDPASASARIATAPAPAPAASSASSTTRSRSSASSISSACVSAMFRSAAGVQLAQHGEDLGPHSIAREAEVRVRLVVLEGEARLGGQPPGVGALEAEEWANHAPGVGREPTERPQPGRHGEPIDHRLGQVGSRVAGGDPRTAGASPEPLRSRIAGIPRGGLDVPLRSRSREDARCGGRSAAANTGRERRARPDPPTRGGRSSRAARGRSRDRGPRRARPRHTPNRRLPTRGTTPEEIASTSPLRRTDVGKRRQRPLFSRHSRSLARGRSYASDLRIPGGPAS